MYVLADSMSYFLPSDKTLLNPHIGFQTFQRFNGDPLEPAETRRWTEGFPIEYSPYSGSLSNGAHPDTTVAYYRVYWRYFEPEEENYNWDLIERALATAHERKQTLMLRLPPHSHLEWPDEELPDSGDVPDWLRKYIGPKWHFPKEAKYNHRFLSYQGTIDPNHPEYIKHYSRAIKSIAERYDGDPRLDSVDLCICGCWGEENSLALMTDENRNALIHAYTDNFKQTPLMAQTNQWELHPYTYNVPVECDNRLSMLHYLIDQNARAGLRGDGLGDMSYRHDTTKWNWGHMRSIYPYIFGDSKVAEMWKKGPISFESCGVMYDWLDLGYDLDEILDQGLKWHISTFSNKGAPVPEEYRERVDKWLRQIGYRFAFRNVNYPGQATGGDTMQIAFWMQNLGVAPIYRNYPFTLRLKGNGMDIRRVIPADVRDWLPGDVVIRDDWTLPLYIPEGNFALQAGICNPRDGNGIIRFANDEPCDEDGFMTIGQIRIVIPKSKF